MNSESVVLWFTGLPCSGKTTLADTLAQKLKERNVSVGRMDSESLGNQDQELEQVIAQINQLSEQNRIVLCDLPVLLQSNAQTVREKTQNFVEIYLSASEEVCRKRFEKNRQESIEDFDRRAAQVESPKNPEIEINTDEQTINESIEVLIQYLEREGFIPAESGYTAEEEQEITDRLKSLGYL